MQRRQERYSQRYGVGPLPNSGYEVFAKTPDYFFVSGFTHPSLPLIRHDGVKMHSWGLIAKWVKDEAQAKELRKKTLNAIGEEIFQKPSYMHSIKTKRGILPVSGFFESRHHNDAAFPYFIKEKDSEFTSLGCVYEEWTNRNTGEVVPTFSIITTAANPLMQAIHNTKKRMPLMLKKEDEEKWLDPALSPDEIKGLIKPFDHTKMDYHTVPKLVNSSKSQRNIAEAIEEFEYDDLPPIVLN